MVKLNININEETEATLREIAARRGITVTEAVRRAVSVYKLVEDEVVAGTKRMQLVDPSGEVTQIAIP